MRSSCTCLLGLTFALGAGQATGQDFHYVEPGVAACPAAPAPTAAAPKAVTAGVAVRGSLTVACGFDQGSYTVSLNSTDPGATFTPRTFIVNFGRIVGNGAYALTFATPGIQGISTAITSNMGSPVVRGRFASAASEFKVVSP